MLTEPVTLRHIMAPSVVLPKKAHVLLCGTCKAAFEQGGFRNSRFHPRGMVTCTF
jgi:hypothetical protein